MRKLLFIGMLLISLHVNAKQINNKFYVGAEGLLNTYTYVVPGGSILGGYRWDQLSTEIGFTKLVDDHWKQGLTFNSQNVFVDGIYTHMLEDKLDLKILLGVGMMYTKVSNPNGYLGWVYQDHDKYNDLGVRAGVGLEYNFAPAWTVGLTYKVQTNPQAFLGFMGIYTLAVRYYI